MVVSQFNSFALISTFVLVSLASFCFPQANGGGFSVDLFHRASPGSPLYNPLETRSERLSAAFRRSINRAKRFNPASSSVSLSSAWASVASDSGEYIMNMSLGSPPFPISAVVDTGSDLTWTQCEPCKDCYKQINPIFDPRKSKTYREISCQSAVCGEIFGASCNGSSSCNYSIIYGDRSYTEGVIAEDTVTLASTSSQPAVLPNTIFGCGFNNQGTFYKEVSGIVGLGRGPESLVSRMGSSIDGKFSYCLVPISPYETSKTSKLYFGDEAVVTGETAVSTPLLTFDIPPRSYYLLLEAISVGSKRLDYNVKPFVSSDANIVLDSGSLLSFLPSTFYSKFESAVAEHIVLKRAEDPNKELSLCYESQSEAIQIPKITVHFHRADLELKEMNIFLRVSKDIVCLAFAPVKYYGLYGNLVQMNFLVGYDTVKNTITFKPTDCTKSN